MEGDSYPSLTPLSPQAQAFEREIAEQFGLKPLGHPWMKRLRYHASWTGRDAWAGKAGEPILPAVGDFYRVEGEEVHEVAVGPVHAGIIEPGHFRFQCHGEKVFHLEIALGFQHRGIEEAMIGGPTKRSRHYVETAAGDTSVGHATAYAQACEILAGCRESARTQVIRGIALELERLANHVGDLGALSGDIGFQPTASFCGRIRGDFLNMTALICGNRFGRGLVEPSGVGFDLDGERAGELSRRLEAAERDTAMAVKLLWDNQSVMARFEDTGLLPQDVATELGVVGPAARASGLARDLRFDQPSGIFRFAQVPVSTCESGDVFARAFVRWLEIQQSVGVRKGDARSHTLGRAVLPARSPRSRQPRRLASRKGGAARSATRPSPTGTGDSPATRSSILPSITGRPWPTRCGARISRTSRSATRASISRIADRTCEGYKRCLGKYWPG